MTGRALIVTVVLAAFCGSLQATSKHRGDANLPKKEIRDLSYAIKAANTYREDKYRTIHLMADSLYRATDNSSRCQFALKLSDTFRPTDTDSALFYAYRACEFSETLAETVKQEANLSVINALSTAGLFTEANKLMERIDTDVMDPETKIKYWMAGRRLFSYMRSYAEGNSECYDMYNKEYQRFDDSLLMHLPSGDKMKLFIESERYVTQGRFKEAKDKLEGLMEHLKQESNLYGMAAFQLAEIWRNEGNEEKYAAYLALSAMSDVMGCVTEGLALPTLANWLYEQGELNEAFGFINFALEEATAGKARMRAVTIAQLVPLIDDAYKEKINASRDELMVYFLLVTLLLIATVTLIVVLYRQIKKSRLNTTRLAETAQRQESYIGNFIGLYSSYANKFNHLARTVSTKIAAGQTAELKKLVDSGKFADQDNDDIHSIFDAAFLDIYPDFISEINSLLRPEEQIIIKTPGTLTPELRIYAFVKLGIDESARIAEILHYSTNTVYTYRNKMRNKALSRETFDHDVTLIGKRV